MSHQHEEPTPTPPDLTGDDAGTAETAAAAAAREAAADDDDSQAEPVAVASGDDSGEVDDLRPSQDPWSSLEEADADADAADDTAGVAVQSEDQSSAEFAVEQNEIGVEGDVDADDADDAAEVRELEIVVEPKAVVPEAVIISEAMLAAEAVAAATLAPVAVDELDEDDAEAAGEEASAAASVNESAVEAAVQAAVAYQAAEVASAPSRGGMFTIPLLCAGIAVIAACLLIPQADANRRLAYERQKLQADLEAVNHQVETNDEFLNKIAADPNLAERLAQRQMKIIRKGNEVLKLGKDPAGAEMSPFQLTAVAPPPELPPYQSRGGPLAKLCYDPKSRLYLIGSGLMAVAAGLVLGFGPRAD